MADVEHSSITDGDLHRPGYFQSSDPGAVGAGKLWVDTSGSPAILKIRNSGDTGWLSMTPRSGIARAVQTSTINYGTSYKIINYHYAYTDTDSCITTGSNWKWTAPYDCFVQVFATLGLQNGGECFMRSYVNGSTHLGTIQTPSAGSWNSAKGGWTASLSDGDYLDVRCKKASGSANNIAGWSYFYIQYTENLG